MKQRETTITETVSYLPESQLNVSMVSIETQGLLVNS